MSAISYDAIPERPGQLLKIAAPELDVPDPTEDIADEVTSELAGVAARSPAPPPATNGTSADSVSEPEVTPVAGSVLRDRYVLEALIGSGGTAMVFQALDLRRATDIVGGPGVAVKLLRPDRRGDARSIARLQREFRQTQAAAHPHVVRFFDLDCDRGSWFIVMELLTGESLATRLRDTAHPGLPRQNALAAAASIAEALAHAHTRGIVHGDVKPANIFVTTTGEVRLFDFGVAPQAHEPAEPTTATRAYASPEVLNGEQPQARDDVFSFACVAYEMLTGMNPRARGAAQAAERAGDLLWRPIGLDEAHWQVVTRGLDLRRSQRPDMTELARALRDASEPGKARPAPLAVAPAAPVAAPARTSVPQAKRPQLIVGAAVAAVLALVLGILIGRLGPDTRPAIAPATTVASVAALPAAPAPEPKPAVTTERGAVIKEARPAADKRVVDPPATTGLVSFDLPAMSVSNRAVVAAIPLRHLSRAQRNASVNWRIIEGSALAGEDFGGPQSGVESFAAGHSFRILYVPILANPASTRDRTFVVELSNASPGTQLVKTPRIAVTILGDR